MEKTIKITFTEKGKNISTSSTMDRDLSVYSAISAMEALIEGLKNKLGEYMHENMITPESDGFAERIKDISINDLAS